MELNNSPKQKLLTHVLSITAFTLLLYTALLYSFRGAKTSPPHQDQEPDVQITSNSTLPEVTYTDVPESIVISSPSEYLVVGKNMDLHYEIIPSSATFSDKLMWASADDKVASVDENGTVTAIGKGQTYITVRTESGIGNYFEINVIEPALFYFSPSTEVNQEYPVGNTNESAQSKIISEYCKEKLVLAGLEVIICEDDSLTIKGRSRDALQKKADYYIAIHTAATSTEGAQIAFNRRLSDSSRMSLYIKDSLTAIIETPTKGTLVSGLNLEIKEMEYTNEQRIPAVIVEAQSHKKAENAQWIIDNQKQIGYSIADGIMEFLLHDVD